MKLGSYDRLAEVAMNNFADAVRTGPPSLIERTSGELLDAFLLGRWTKTPRSDKTYDDCVINVTRTYEAINGIYPQNAEQKATADMIETNCKSLSPVEDQLRRNIREIEQQNLRLAQDIVEKSSRIVDLQDKLNGAQQRINDLVRNVRELANQALKIINAG